MARSKLTHNRADIRAMWELTEKMGQEPVAVKLHPAGTFRIMTLRHTEAKSGPTTHPMGHPVDQVVARAPVEEYALYPRFPGHTVPAASLLKSPDEFRVGNEFVVKNRYRWLRLN